MVSRLSEIMIVAAPFLSGTSDGVTSPQVDSSLTVPPKPAAVAPASVSAVMVSENFSCSLTTSGVAPPVSARLKPHAASPSFLMHWPQRQCRLDGHAPSAAPRYEPLAGFGL